MSLGNGCSWEFSDRICICAGLIDTNLLYISKVNYNLHFKP